MAGEPTELMLNVDLEKAIYILNNFGWLIFLALAIAMFREFWMVKIVTGYVNSIKWMMLEIKIPRENAKSIRSMEQVFATVYTIYSFGLRPWERFVEGKVESWVSFEITGDETGIHFYVYTPEKHRNLIETAFFSQYPDVELHEVEDYTKSMPKILPNNEYEIFASDIILAKDDAYPIRTYVDFEDLKVEEESDKIDPVSIITETISKLKPGEKVWLQVIVRPADSEWAKKATQVIDEEAGRKQKAKKMSPTASGGEFLGNLARAPIELPTWSNAPKQEQTFRFYTPGETEKLKAMSRKASKRAFDTIIRFVYIDKKDEYTGENVESVLGAMQQYATLDMNFFKPNRDTFTKKSTVSKYFWRRKKLLVKRKLKMYQAYINREIPQPHIPKIFRLKLKTCILNIEELASIYHPPTISVRAPKLRPAQFKKGEPPVDLPIVEE